MYSKQIVRGLAHSASAAFEPAVKANIGALKNGVKIGSEATGGALTSVTVHVNAGSRHGAAHGSARLLQRLSTRGTKKRSPDQLRADLAAVGGNLQTSIDRESTVYTLNVLHRDAARAVELLGDMVANPNIDEKNVNEERARHANEHRDIHTEMMEHLHETAFHESPMGRTVSGAENAHQLTAVDVQTYFTSQITADRISIGVVGGAEHAAVAEAAEKAFSGLKAGAGDAKVAPAVYRGSDKLIRYDSMDKAHVYMAYKSCHRGDALVYPSLVLQQLLGSWCRNGPLQLDAASRLARIFAENDCVHSFSAFNKFYSDTGLFGVHYVASDNRLNSAQWYLMDNLVRIVHNVHEEEIERAKAQLLTHHLGKQESVNTASQSIARQLAHYDRRISREETIARIKEITIDDVKEAANTFYHDEDHVMAAKGPIFELPDYNWIRRRAYWVRY